MLEGLKRQAAAVIATAAIVMGATLPAPAHAVIFQTGDVFAAVGNGNIDRFASDGTFIETLNIGAGGFTTGMAFDAAGNLFATGFTVNTVAKFDNDGNLLNSNFLSGLSTPESIVIDQSGNIFVGNLGNGIRKYDSDGNFLGTVISTSVDWFDLTADQSTFVFGQEGINILTVSNALPGTQGPNFNADPNSLTSAFAMRILPDGGLLVADQVDIKRFDSSGNLTQTFDQTGVDGWFALNLDPDGTSFWSGSFNDGILRKFDIGSGALLQSINTGCGASCLFGVAVFGEITVGGPGLDDDDDDGVSVPEPPALGVLAMGLLLLGFSMSRQRHRV